MLVYVYVTEIEMIYFLLFYRNWKQTHNLSLL